MKYVILADSKSGSTFKVPRQLTEINGEPVIARTVRLLHENGVKDVIITSHDKRFDGLGAQRYEPLFNDYDREKNTGYWLSGFPIELLNEPICFIFGDVYFSENAIKTIVDTPTNSTLFFCTYNNDAKEYIKHHDEPLAYKVVDYELFKLHIAKVKEMFDNKQTVRHPIVWELYRSINGQDINVHAMTNNYLAINDISCDIDSVKDINNLKIKLGGKEMVKAEVIEEFTLERFDELKNIERAKINTKGRLYVGDKFECSKDLCDYLMGANALKRAFVKIIEIIPEKVKEPETTDTVTHVDEKIEPKATAKKSKKSKNKK